MIGRQTFQAKHGTAERWDTCDCAECLAGLDAAGIPVTSERRERARRAVIVAAGDRLETVGRTMPEGLLAAARTIRDPATGDLVRVSLRRFVAGTLEHRQEAERLGFSVEDV